MLKTDRLLIKPANLDSVPLILKLWNSPEIMTYVGFPNGLSVTESEIIQTLQKSSPALINYLLVIQKQDDLTHIGQAFIHPPDESGISETDIKILPEYHNLGYGSEVKKALCDFLFQKTRCIAVQATPNLQNAASIKMQEKIGALRLGRGRFTFSNTMKIATHPVDYWLYRKYKNSPLHSDIRKRQLMFAAIVPAAGRSKRMGKFKQLLPWPPEQNSHITVIEQTINSLLLSGCDPVIVVTGHNKDAVHKTLKGWPVVCVHNPNPDAPMGSSISLGSRKLKELISSEYPRNIESFFTLILPGDHPSVKPDTIRLLIQHAEENQNQIHLPEYNHRGGHPALFPYSVFSSLLNPDSKVGLRALIHGDRSKVTRHDTSDSGVIKNLDYPSDYH